jgi:hypothetical protein
LKRRHFVVDFVQIYRQQILHEGALPNMRDASGVGWVSLLRIPVLDNFERKPDVGGTLA